MWESLSRSLPTLEASEPWNPLTECEWGPHPHFSFQEDRCYGGVQLKQGLPLLKERYIRISKPVLIYGLVKCKGVWWSFCISPLSLASSFSSCFLTSSHIEALKPLAMWGQQFCPTRGKWRGAACQGDERWWPSRCSVSHSLRPGDSLPFQSRPTVFPPAAPFCLELEDTPPGVEAPRISGNVRKCRGSIFTLASTIWRMPFSKISWQVTKKTEKKTQTDLKFLINFDMDKWHFTKQCKN